MGSGFHSPFSIHVEDLGPMRISTSLEQVKETVVPSTADQLDDTELLYPWGVTSDNKGSISAVKCGSGCLHSLAAVSIIILLCLLACKDCFHRLSLTTVIQLNNGRKCITVSVLILAIILLFIVDQSCT